VKVPTIPARIFHEMGASASSQSFRKPQLPVLKLEGPMQDLAMLKKLVPEPISRSQSGGFKSCFDRCRRKPFIKSDEGSSARPTVTPNQR
jgi:hypothetical protein